jgi:hypothetical protein
VSISPGELALASIGIVAVLGDDIPKVGVGRKADMARLEASIPKLAKQLVAGDLDHTPMARPHTYNRLLEVLGGLPRSVDVGKWIDKFNIEDQADLGAPFALAAQSALNDLAAVFPRQSYVTLTGPKVLPPPTTQLTDFYFVLDAVNDPLRVFSYMSVGGLIPRIRDAVKLVFPGISSAIDDAISEALVNATAEKSTDPTKLTAGMRVSPRVTFGIQTWRGQRTAEFRPPQQTPQPGGPGPKKSPARSGKEDGALSKATASQKLDAAGV